MNGSSFIVVAYIDPGTGGILLQVLLAGLLGLTYRFRQAVAKFFRKITGRKEPTQPEESSGPPK